jgi:serine protease Do
VVDDDLILINGSVVTASTTGAQPHSFKVRFGTGDEVLASFVGRDEFANIAFLRLEGPLPKGVEPIRFKAEPKLHIGDPMYVLGLLPENLEPMVRLFSGEVVAHVERPKDFYVTDLSVEQALGGPVFNAKGQVVGVLSELGDSGPSFASGFSGGEETGAGLIIDSDLLTRLIAQPPRKGEARRAWIGITLQALDRDKAEYWGLGNTTGIVVNSVVPGSPADEAGLREGDLVVSLNGAPIPVSQEEHVPIFVEQVGSSPVGSKLELGVIRQGKRFETRIGLVAAPKSRLDAASRKVAGPEWAAWRAATSSRRWTIATSRVPRISRVFSMTPCTSTSASSCSSCSAPVVPSSSPCSRTGTANPDS